MRDHVAVEIVLVHLGLVYREGWRVNGGDIGGGIGGARSLSCRCRRMSRRRVGSRVRVLIAG